jgi:hypothetical protein
MFFLNVILAMRRVLWIVISRARVAKLADAPDLGLRNHRFQNVAFRCKAKRFYDGKTPVLAKSRHVANGEQKGAHSSTNSSTHAPDFAWFGARFCRHLPICASLC